MGASTAVLILGILVKAPSYGYEIVKRANEESEDLFVWQEGTIYPALHKLEGKELIRGQWVEASNGKMRRVYSLTDGGKRALIANAKEWNVYSKAVENILEASYA